MDNCAELQWRSIRLTASAWVYRHASPEVSSLFSGICILGTHRNSDSIFASNSSSWIFPSVSLNNCSWKCHFDNHNIQWQCNYPAKEKALPFICSKLPHTVRSRWECYRNTPKEIVLIHRSKNNPKLNTETVISSGTSWATDHGWLGQLSYGQAGLNACPVLQIICSRTMLSTCTKLCSEPL